MGAHLLTVGDIAPLVSGSATQTVRMASEDGNELPLPQPLSPTTPSHCIQTGELSLLLGGSGSSLHLPAPTPSSSSPSSL